MYTPAPQHTGAPAGAPRRRRIGEVLVAAGVITDEQLQRALAERTGAGGRRERLGATIVRLGLGSEEDIAEALATQLGLEFVPDDDLVVDPAAAARVPTQVAQRHSVVGIAVEEGDRLVVATPDPTNVVAADDLRLATRARSLRLVVVTQRAAQDAVQQSYAFGQRADALLDQLDDQLPDDPELDDELAGVEDAPVVRLAESILQDALRQGASDVHVEPTERGMDVRYRIDGVLVKVTTIPRGASGALMSRLKLMSNMDIAEKRRPQDGRARLRGAGGEVDLRASTLPSMHGEVMVMRLLRKGGDRLDLHEVGLTEAHMQIITDAIERPQGMILITGPTGSGKTSTLYAMLARLARDTHNLITLEDPVEYQLEGVNQTQINAGIGLTFARALRTVLRQDPDVVMLGEIRDPEAAEIAIQASLTGHMVFSTLHTNEASGAVVRLRDLDVPSYLISSALSLVMAQRLARRLCRNCAVESPPDPEVAAQLRLGPRDLAGGRWLSAGGCPRCSHSGYKGRIGVYELIEVTGRVREALSSGGNETAIRQAARAMGSTSLREDALNKARQGLTTLEEVLRVTPNDPVDRGVCPTCALNVESDFQHCPWCATDLRGLACDTCGRDLATEWSACPACGSQTPHGERVAAAAVTEVSDAAAEID